MRRLFATVFAIASGLIVLLGGFVPVPTLQYMRQELILWAVILAAVGVVVGVFNLLTVHMGKVSRREKGYPYSLLLVISLLSAAILGLILGPQSAGMRTLVEAVVIPVETSLMAILTVTLAYACVRLLRRRLDWMTAVFLVVVFLVLLGTAPLPFMEVGLLNYLIRPWIAHVPAVAGARGLLIGVSLGALLTGLRILLGADRPYGGK